MVVAILLWNTEGNKLALEVLLEEAKYDILSIQEPWINRQTKSTYCPRSAKYHLIHAPGGRTALYVKDSPSGSGITKLKEIGTVCGFKAHREHRDSRFGQSITLATTEQYQQHYYNGPSPGYP